MFGIGMGELVLLLVIALVVFGPERLPELGRTVGKAVRDFKAATESVQSEISRSLEDTEGEKSPSSTKNGSEKESEKS